MIVEILTRFVATLFPSLMMRTPRDETLVMQSSDMTSSLRMTGNVALGFLRSIEFRPVKSIEELRAVLGLAGRSAWRWDRS